MSAACPSCGTPNPPEARFCMACGGALSTPVRQADERRVVTIVFVDLVGFTERSDQADPEDVRRTLVPYHAGVKERLERYGGVLDKFIGDGVMGVFGAPTAHDDDPVRAVEAAMSVLEMVQELRRDDPEIAVRIGVNTGEVVVSFGAGPQVGESVAGDVVNTASRLQALAPRDGVVVGELTARDVERRFELQELPPATVKGKSDPVRVWQVLARRAVEAAEDVPVRFVGRETELRVLVDAYRDAVRTSRSRSVLIVGEPGIGKSRMLQELRARLASEAPAPNWYATRCQPYGEDVSFRPAGRLVEAVLGLDGSEDLAVLRERLDQALRDRVASRREREGVVLQLERLARGANVREEPASTKDLAAAAATLWSSTGPAVIAVEDVHWAEPALIQLLSAGAAELRDRPLLLVATARPSSDLPFSGAIPLQLGPLGEEETRDLVDELVSSVGFGERERSTLAERAEGNPLFAVEFVRALADRAESALTAMPVPDTLRSVIGARLDAVPSELRSTVLDAAVFGPEFWPPALAAVGEVDQAVVLEALDALVSRGVAVRGQPAWFRDVPTYRFTHALFREVAYTRLPRAPRARKHLRAGRWLEEASGDRAQERADAIAHHYEQAFVLAQAARDEGLTERAREPAARWLNVAGRHARLLDARGAYDRHERALRIAAPETIERARALAYTASMGARAAVLDGREALRRIEEGVGIARRLGDHEVEGWALVRQYSQMAFMGEGAKAEHVLDSAIDRLERFPPSEYLAEAYAYRSEEAMFAGRTEDSLRWAERALEVADAVGSDSAIMALHLRGNARCERGEDGGLDDLRVALERAEALGSTMDVVYSLMYLGEWAWLLEGPVTALEHIDAARGLAGRRGITRQLLWSTGGSLGPLFDVGRWSDLLDRLGVLRGIDPDLIDPTLICVADIWSAKLAIARGDRSIAPEGDDLVRRAAQIGEMHVIAPGLNVAALLAIDDGDPVAAVRYLEELLVTADTVSAPTYREEVVADATRLAIAAGDLSLAERFAEGEPTTARARCTYATAHAAVMEARGDAGVAAEWREVAAAWEGYGAPYERSLALDALGRCLERTGASDDAMDARRAGEELRIRLGAVCPRWSPD